MPTDAVPGILIYFQFIPLGSRI